MTTPSRFAAPLVLAVLSLALAGPPAAAGAKEPRVVELTAKRFEFVPGEITLRRGEPAVLRVRSGDVTHGFYSKPLGIDTTIEAGGTVDVPVTPAQAGRFTVICDHFCGSGHGNMHLVVVVEEGPAEAGR